MIFLPSATSCSGRLVSHQKGKLSYNQRILHSQNQSSGLLQRSNPRFEAHLGELGFIGGQAAALGFQAAGSFQSDGDPEDLCYLDARGKSKRNQNET